MKKTNIFANFNIMSFIGNFIGFMILINLFFFIEGAFFTDGGYIFDADKFIWEQFPIAFLCSFCSAFIRVREP